MFEYFNFYSLKARKLDGYATTDIYRPYIDLLRSSFQILILIVDKFPIVQLLTGIAKHAKNK